MAELTPREIEDLVLGYEELGPQEKAVVDEHLAGDPALAARLAWHRRIESEASRPVSVDEEAWADSSLGSEDRRHQRESLRRILASLGAASRPSPSRSRRGVDWRVWSLPLAAVLAMIAFWPSGDVHAPLRTLEVIEIAASTAPVRGVAGTLPDGASLRTGDSFALELDLDADSHVAVFHVDPSGAVARVFPPEADRLTRLLAGGRIHRVPESSSSEAWVLGGGIGTERFVIALFGEAPHRLAWTVPPDGESDSASVAARLRTWLAGLADQVEQVSFEHVE